MLPLPWKPSDTQTSGGVSAAPAESGSRSMVRVWAVQAFLLSVGPPIPSTHDVSPDIKTIQNLTSDVKAALSKFEPEPAPQSSLHSSETAIASRKPNASDESYSAAPPGARDSLDLDQGAEIQSFSHANGRKHELDPSALQSDRGSIAGNESQANSQYCESEAFGGSQRPQAKLEYAHGADWHMQGGSGPKGSFAKSGPKYRIPKSDSYRRFSPEYGSIPGNGLSGSREHLGP